MQSPNREFNIFPHVPGKAMKRHAAIIEILKRLQEQNTQLRYQICLGKDDLDVRVKNHLPNDYRPYVKVEIKTLDPNGEVPEWELSYGRVNPFSREGGTKRQAEESPKNQKSTKKRISVPEWKVWEFLWMFLEGTKTTPDYGNEEENLAEDEFDESINNEDEGDDMADSREGNSTTN